MLIAAKRPLVISGGGVDRAGANEALLAVVDLLNCPGREFDCRALVGADGSSELSLRLRHCRRPRAPRVRRDPRRRLADGQSRHSLRQVLGRPLQSETHPGGHRSAQHGRHAPARTRDRRRREERARGLAACAQDKARAAEKRRRYGALSARPLTNGARSVSRRSRSGADRESIRRTRSKQSARCSAPTVSTSPTAATPRCGRSGFLPSTKPRSFLNILELGMLGTGIPSSIGAKLGNPSREVVCVSGDGAAGFNFMEMQTAAREGLKVRVIVFAEGSWTMEEPNERRLWGKTFGTEMGTVRWDKVAEGLGCKSFYVDTHRRSRRGAKRRAGRGRSRGHLPEDQSRRQPRDPWRTRHALRRGLPRPDGITRRSSFNTGCRGHSCRRKRETHRGFHIILSLSRAASVPEHCGSSSLYRRAAVCRNFLQDFSRTTAGAAADN